MSPQLTQRASEDTRHYVIIRDDDTNAFTPPECLEQLYRPFLQRGLPVNLAVIPNVRRGVKTPTGQPEAFLFGQNGNPSEFVPITRSPELLAYLKSQPALRVAQHGCHHDTFEFDLHTREQISRRIVLGAQTLEEAGLSKPLAFVAPHDKISRESYSCLAANFRVISTGWFELRRLPHAWWPAYAVRKVTKQPHWRRNGTLLLSHPGCLLSRHRPMDSILDNIRREVHSTRLTVLVTHWWEYFPDQKPDKRFIDILHQTADFLAGDPAIRVISFEDLVNEKVSLN